MDGNRDAYPSGPGRVRPSSGRHLVGRASEKAQLQDAFDSAVGGQGTVVLIGGEAGIGKTTLARHLMTMADRQDTRTLTGRCYEQANAPPYGPWIDMFADYAPALQSGPSPPPSLASGRLHRVASQAALFGEVGTFCIDLTHSGPAVILLEDLHWSDPASVELLRHLSTTINRWPLLIVVTYRTEELSRYDPLYQHFPAILRGANGTSIHLRRLGRAAMAELVSQTYDLGPTDTDHLVRYLDQHADGNPFFASELLRSLEEHDLIRDDGSHTVLGDIDHIVLPPLIKQIIDNRVDLLGPEMRSPLEMASVIGQEVPLTLWSTLAELDEPRVLDLVERATRLHLLEADRDGETIHFVHAITRETLYEGILPLRRRQLHREVADAIIAHGDSEPEDIATHLQLAGDPRAVDWLLQAATRAQQGYAWIAASERFRSAARLVERIPGHEDFYCDLIFQSAHLARFSYPAETAETLQEVIDLAGDLDDQVLQAEAQLLYGHHLCYMQRFQDGLTQISTGLAQLESMPADFDRIASTIQSWFPDASAIATSDALSKDKIAIDQLHDHGYDPLRCLYLWHMAAAGHGASAITMGEDLATILPSGDAPHGSMAVIRAFVDHGLAVAYATVGAVTEARQAARESRALFGNVDHFALIGFSLLHELRALSLSYGAGDPSERRELASQAETALAQAGGAFRLGMSPRLAWLGCMVLDGHWHQADRVLQDLSPPGNSYLQVELTLPSAQLAYYRGETELVWRDILSLLPAGPATRSGDCVFLAGCAMQRLAAHLCLDRGALDEATQWLHAHDGWHTDASCVAEQAEGKLVWSRLRVAQGDLAAASEEAEAAMTLARVHRLPLVELSAWRLRGELATLANDFASAMAHFQHSLNLAELCEVPYERSLTLLALANAELESGDLDASRQHLQQARAFCEQEKATRTLAQIDALLTRIMVEPRVHPDGLTNRETEVLQLVARGHTDREIAELLFISHHTVSTHVKRILGKLDVPDRRGATRYARDHGLLSPDT